MPESAHNLDAVFSALSDATRRAILARLTSGQARVTDLAEPFDVSLPAVSKHLRVLEAAGLIAREREGRVHWCRLVPHPMRDAAEWLADYRRFWERQLDALDAYLRTTKREETRWQRLKPAKTPPSTSRGHSPRRAKKSSARGRTPKR